MLRSLRRTLAGLLAVAIVPVTVIASASPAAADTSQFRGVNWARLGDNFHDGPLVLEGLDASDSYATVRAKADAVYTGFQNNLGANTVRLPINTHSVGTAWWNSYTGTIDAATAKGFKVVLSYWEDGSPWNGTIPNMGAFNTMWNTVIAKYGSNGLVYFEPMNEPRGYSGADWANIAANWIAAYPSIPRSRIFISGTGYNDDVRSVCADGRFDGTILSFHHYAFMSAPKTYDQWVAHFRERLGSCAWRTVLDEFGSPMDNGLNYNDANSSDNFVRYLRADTDTVRSLAMGAIYWPGLGGATRDRPTYDWYSMQKLNGSGNNLVLSTRNTTGVDRLKYAWGTGNGSPTSALRNVGAGRCLDVPGATQQPVQVEAYTCNGGSNQQWTRTASGQITVYSGQNLRCLDAYGHGTTNGTVVGTYNCSTQDNQKWVFYSDGTIRGLQSGLCLDVDLATAKVILWSCWGGNNQKWQ